MHEKNKNPLPGLLLIGLFLLFIPFIFIRDFYPFMRLGMFAEPVRHEVQKETFLVLSNDTLIRSLDFGLPPENFQYLCRNYHYRNEEKQLLINIAESLHRKGELIFLKATPQDTITLTSYVP